MSRFGDPTFEYHAAMARFYGAMTIKMASASSLPFNFLDYCDELEHQIALLANASIVNVTALSSAVADFRAAAVRTYAELHDDASTDTGLLAAINRRLMLTERCFLDAQLSPVPWFWYPNP